MHKLERMLRERIAGGLERSSINQCSKWAELYRVMGKPFPGKWTLKYHPWLKDIMDCHAPVVVGEKAAQMGYSEACINKAFYSMDVEGNSVMYVLPSSTPDASDFSSQRFDPALELSDHLEEMFSDVKNVGHKRAGSASLLIRGSRSRSQLKSAPVAKMIFDEVDEMNQKNVSLAFERMSGQQEEERQAYMVSTPTVNGYGIDGYYAETTQRLFCFQCPHCIRWTNLVFPECLEITAEDPNDLSIHKTHLKCKECGHALDHKSKIDWLQNYEWVATYEGRINEGFKIPQLYSMVMAPWEIGAAYLKSLTNPTDEQEFHNSKLGEPHIVKNAKLTDLQINDCIGDYTMYDAMKEGFFISMGADVGKWIHYSILLWTFDPSGNDLVTRGRPRLIKCGKVKAFEHLDRLMSQYHVRFAVVDAQPERRESYKFATRFRGHALMCFYGKGLNSRQITMHPDNERSVTVDRTSWLDLTLGRVKSQQMTYPKDLPLEYREHLKALVRVYELDNDGNPTGRYVTGNRDQDHYAHAQNYAEIAMPLGLGLGVNQEL